MRPQLQIKRIEDIQEWLESSKDISATQSIGFMIDHLVTLCTELAFVNGQLPLTKQLYNKAKVRAYNNMVASSHSQQHPGFF
jgi:hypothetical protein